MAKAPSPLARRVYSSICWLFRFSIVCLARYTLRQPDRQPPRCRAHAEQVIYLSIYTCLFPYFVFAFLYTIHHHSICILPFSPKSALINSFRRGVVRSLKSSIPFFISKDRRRLLATWKRCEMKANIFQSSEKMPKTLLEKERQHVQRAILEEVHKVEEQITCYK